MIWTNTLIVTSFPNSSPFYVSLLFQWDGGDSSPRETCSWNINVTIKFWFSLQHPTKYICCACVNESLEPEAHLVWVGGSAGELVLHLVVERKLVRWWAGGKKNGERPRPDALPSSHNLPEMPPSCSVAAENRWAPLSGRLTVKKEKKWEKKIWSKSEPWEGERGQPCLSPAPPPPPPAWTLLSPPPFPCDGTTPRRCWLCTGSWWSCSDRSVWTPLPRFGLTLVHTGPGLVPTGKRPRWRSQWAAFSTPLLQLFPGSGLVLLFFCQVFSVLGFCDSFIGNGLFSEEMLLGIVLD